jgi:hypothetical protein
MKIKITMEGRTPTMKVTEGKVTCVLTLGKEQEIKTTGEDVNGLAKRIAFSHRTQFGQGYSGMEYLELVKMDLEDRESAKKEKE